MTFKRIKGAAVLLILCSRVAAQNTVPHVYLNNMVQPAPNAAALGKYADYPVSYYTGVPDINIPLYDLKDGGINLPVSLSYHASGIRVSELATWVGLGWVLNAGGIITRTVMGAPDEGTHKVASGTVGPRGYYKDFGLYNLPLVPYPLSNGQSSDPYNNFWTYTSPGLSGGFLDGEPDLYTFNFNGHVGKFVFDEYRHPQLLEDDNLKISVNYSIGNFNSFTITTADGVKYVFGENNTFEVTSPHSSASDPDIDSWAPSSWLLTTIINPNTKDTATLTYAAETYAYRDLGSETNLYLSPAPNSMTSNVHIDALHNACDVTDIINSFLATAINGQRLTTIKTKNYTIKFIANSLRNDLTATIYSTAPPTNSFCLDSVKIFNNINVCVKQFALSHTYFTSTSATASAVTSYLSQYNNDASDTKRLKLTAVTEYSGDGLLQKPPYVITYNESIQLPRRLSYDQDHWGFSNYTFGNYNPYFTPPVYDGLCTVSGAGANRNSAFPAMSAFTLTAIQDPLGAVTNFVYEANTATNANPANSTVGGLRVKQISVTDNVTGVTKIRTFDYANSGYLFRMPTYLTRLYNEFYWALQMGLSGNNGFVGYSQPYTIWGILRQSQSVVPLQDPQGGHIGYASVKETSGANGEGGYTTRLFKVIPAGTDSLSSRLNLNNANALGYTAYAMMNNQYGLYGNGRFNDIPAQNLTYYNGYNINNYYPYVPLQVDLQRGKLLSEQTFDSSGNPVTSTDYVYDHTYHETPVIRGVKSYPSATTPVNGQTIQWYALSFYKLHTGISRLRSTTKKTYNGSNYVAEVINYDYESPYHTLKTSETTTDSQGNTLISKTYYSLDYAPTATSDNVFGKMQSRNLLEPVRTDNWKNGNLVDERVTAFKDFAASSPDTLIYPSAVYSLETAQPMTVAQANENTTWGSLVATLLPNTSLISKVGFTYDPSTGKLITQQLTLDKSQGVQWSKGLKMPVAVVDNTQNTPALKEFYYEGFEESTVSNLYTGNGHTGTKSVFAPYTVNWTIPNPNSRSYVISYWYFANGIWNPQPEQPFTGTLVLSGGTAYDDIRIHPTNASMVTYTYDPNGNVTSSTDAKNLTTYYEYDSFLRLRNIRDYQKNIVKSICYNYNGQANGCFINMPSYSNALAFNAYARNNCSSGYTGTSVTYTVPAGTYISNSSQQDADNQAQQDAALNGYNYANIYGSCIINVAFTLSNSTNSGYQINFSNSTSSYTYNFANNGITTIQVPAGTYNISVYPTGAYINHTIEFTSQTTVVAPRTSYSGIAVTPGSNLTLSIY